MDGPVIDPKAIAALRNLGNDNGQDLVDELIETFMADVPLRLEDLSHCVRRGDAPGAARLAHRVKGSAAHLGARRLAGLCGALEQAERLETAPSDGPDDVEELLGDIEREYERVAAALLRVKGKPLPIRRD